MVSRLLWGLTLVAASGWAQVPAAPPALDLRAAPVVLLGEVHDNVAQHSLRVQAVRALLEAGARPALLMEQFDRERQGDIDAARSAMAPPSARELIAAASPRQSGWDWDFYAPFVELALQYGLPLVAANVSRADARLVMTQGLTAQGYDAAVPADIERVQANDIERNHCGMLDAGTALRMAAAQVARDQFMAQLVDRYAERGVVLLAGNGHVRIDVGVPRWLTPATRGRSLSIGLIEEGDDPPGAFDRVLITVRQVREDPCRGMRPGNAPKSG